MISLGVFFLWTVISLWLNYSGNIYFTSGNPEKRHGWFFYMALFSLFSSSNQSPQKNADSSCIPAFLLFLECSYYSLFQKIGLDPLAPFYETRLDINRAFGSLGNPNYLAGFILIVSPTSSRQYLSTNEHIRLSGISFSGS